MAPAHPGSPPPRKRLMLATQVQGQGQHGAVSECMAGVRQPGLLDAFEQPPSPLGKARRHHSDPGACVLKMHRPGQAPLVQPSQGQAPTAAGLTDDAQHRRGQYSKLSIKRERTSAEGGDEGHGSSTQAGSPPSFSITVDCRADGSAATALWQRMHQLELRNKELEQQLIERMQAAQISNGTSGSSSSNAVQRGLNEGQQADRKNAVPSPRAQAALPEMDAPVAMDVEAPCTTSHPPKSSSHRSQHLLELPPLTPAPRQQVGQTTSRPQQQQHQQQLQDTASAPTLVASLRQQISALQRDLQRQKQLYNMLQSDNADLEAVLKETERQRRDFAARYAFMTLDTDGDGYVSVEQVLMYDLFSCYAPSVLTAAFNVWRWDSGFPGYLCMDDFVRFVEYAEDRSTRESQRFWFTVMDADGDGRLSWGDMKLLYDAVQRSCNVGILLHFEDLMNQIRDMVARQQDPVGGFTAQELWESKLGAGVIGLLTNANNMLLQRSTAEWGRGDFPL